MKKILAILVLFFMSSSVFAVDYFELGKKEFYKQNYTKAEVLFKQALEQNPENYPCHYYLAHTYAYNDEIFKAKEEYSRVITFSPNKTLQKLAMQSMYNLNKISVTSSKAQIATNNTDNYFDKIKLGDEYVRWGAFPVRVYVAPSSNTEIIKRAFADWQKATDNKVSFTFEQSEDNAQIIAHIQNQLNADLSTFEGGVAEVRVRNSYIYKSEIDILDKNPFNDKALSKDVIYTSALHEIGHALGLQGHSSDKSDVMVAKDEPKKKTLSKRDINTMLMLYSEKATILNAQAKK